MTELTEFIRFIRFVKFIRLVDPFGVCVFTTAGAVGIERSSLAAKHRPKTTSQLYQLYELYQLYKLYKLSALDLLQINYRDH